MSNRMALGDVCEIIAGQSPPSKYYNSKGVGLPFFQGKADFGELSPNIRVWCSQPYKVAEPGDVLISVRAPVGPTNLANVKCCIGRGLAAIRPGSNIDTKYLLHYLRYIEPELAQSGRGSTFSAITVKELRNLEIPLPPLPEQRRIAAVLDAADGLRGKRRAALAKLDELLQAVFLEMFGDPVGNERGWEVVKAIDVCDCIVPGRDKPKSFTGSIPWITTEDLVPLGITRVPNKKQGLTLDEISEVRARIIPEGSVLLTCVGDLGVTSIAGCEMVVNQQLHTFQCSSLINNMFLTYSLSHQKAYMHRMASSTTVPYMNKTVCNNLPTILPPVTKQNQFASIVYRCENERKKQAFQLQTLNKLFNSLQQRAFRGGL